MDVRLLSPPRPLRRLPLRREHAPPAALQMGGTVKAEDQPPFTLESKSGPFELSLRIVRGYHSLGEPTMTLDEKIHRFLAETRDQRVSGWNAAPPLMRLLWL